MRIAKFLIILLLAPITPELNALQEELKERDHKKQQETDKTPAPRSWQCAKTIQEAEGPVFLDSFEKNGTNFIAIGTCKGTVLEHDPKTSAHPSFLFSLGAAVTALAINPHDNHIHIASTHEGLKEICITHMAKDHTHVRQECIKTSGRVAQFFFDKNVLNYTTKSEAHCCFWDEKGNLSNPKTLEIEDFQKLHRCTDRCSHPQLDYSALKNTIRVQDPKKTTCTIYRSDSPSVITALHCGIEKNISEEHQFDFMSGEDDGTIRLWKHNRERSICSIKKHCARITALHAMDIEKEPHIISASDDGTIKIWQLRQKERIIERPIKDDKPENYKKCAVCPRQGTNFAKLKLCARCQDPGIGYCSRECQTKHWPTHKPMCHPAQVMSASKKGPSKAGIEVID